MVKRKKPRKKKIRKKKFLSHITIAVTLGMLLALPFIIYQIKNSWEKHQAWLAPVWQQKLTITFTEKPYIPKAVLPTQYPNQYDIVIITPNAKIPTGGVIVPPPQGPLSIREAIKNSLAILDEETLTALEKQFKAQSYTYNWADHSPGKSYTGTYLIPRRIALKPKKFFIIINLPDYKIYLYQLYNEEKYLIKTYDCIIGHPLFQTPIIQTYTNRFFWNPIWIPPKSEWAEKYDKIEAGGINPLGKAGMLFGSVYMIHGSEYPLRQAISHGCVRMANEDIAELVWYLQNQYEKPLSAQQKIFFMKYLKSVVVPMPHISITFIYQPFKIENDSFIVLKDIYEKEEYYDIQNAKRIIRAHGVKNEIYENKLQHVIEFGRKHGTSIPLSQLIKTLRPAQEPQEQPAPAKQTGGFLWWGNESMTTKNKIVFDSESIIIVTRNISPGSMAVSLDAVLASANAQQRPF